MTEAEFRALKPGDIIGYSNYECEVLRPVFNSVHENGYKVRYLKNEMGPDFEGNAFIALNWNLIRKAKQEANHYAIDGIPEAWEVIEALQSSWPEDIRYHVGNVLKYVFRLGRKQGASVESDLEKIRNYADRAIKVLGKAGSK